MAQLEVVGVSEVADMLGRPAGTVAVWVHRGKLPEPDAFLACGPIWRKSTIRRWARKHPYGILVD